MDVVRNASGEGRFIHIERNVPKQSAVPGKTALVGTVTRQSSGDGITHFEKLTGSSGLDLSDFNRPPFIIPPGQISAQVVDRLLDSDGSAADWLADSVVSVLSRKKNGR
jgi:hypothetical protein